MKWRVAATFATVGLLWGSAWIPVSRVSPYGSSLRTGALRFAIAAGFTASLGLLSRLPHLSRITAHYNATITITSSLILGVTMLGLPYALTVWANGRVSPGVVATIFAAMPLTALLISGDGAGRAIPALVAGMAGVVELVSQGISGSSVQLSGGLLFAAAVGLGAVSLNYLQKRLRPENCGHSRSSTNILASASIQLGVAAILLAALGAFTERGEAWLGEGQALLWLVLLGVLVSALPLLLLYWLLTQLQAWQVAALQWSATLVAVAEAGWFLRVRPSLEMWVGGALIAAATVWLLQNGGVEIPIAVTLQITNHTFDRTAASDSKVGFEIDSEIPDNAGRLSNPRK